MSFQIPMRNTAINCVVITVFFCRIVGTVGVLCLFISACACDMYRCRFSSRHTLGSAISLYLFYRSVQIIGPVLKRRVERETTNCRKTQEDLLMRFMTRNAKTEYGIKYNFSGIKSREDFVRSHPLCYYDHYDAYVERMADGETNILTSTKLQMVALSSGTTGKSKKLPLTDWNKLILPLYMGILPLSLLIKVSKE